MDVKSDVSMENLFSSYISNWTSIGHIWYVEVFYAMYLYMDMLYDGALQKTNVICDLGKIFDTKHTAWRNFHSKRMYWSAWQKHLSDHNCRTPLSQFRTHISYQVDYIDSYLFHRISHIRLVNVLENLCEYWLDPIWYKQLF